MSLPENKNKIGLKSKEAIEEKKIFKKPQIAKVKMLYNKRFHFNFQIIL